MTTRHVDKAVNKVLITISQLASKKFGLVINTHMSLPHILIYAYVLPQLIEYVLF